MVIKKCKDGYEAPHRCPYGDRCTSAHWYDETLLNEDPNVLSSYRSQLFDRLYEEDAYYLWSKRFQQPVKHLEREDLQDFRTMPYMVSPKADGVRKVIVSELTSGDVSLVNYGETKRQQEREKLGENVVGDEFRGFIIDIEEVMLPSQQRLLVAFDILAFDLSIARKYHETMNSSSLVSLFPDVRIANGQRIVNLVSLEQRQALLLLLVEAMAIPHLIVKPWRPASEVADVWKISENLPYPVDGLIFSPLNITLNPPLSDASTERKPRSYKWKPQDKLTIDVAVCSPAVETKDGGRQFVPYLLSKSNRDPWDSDEEDEEDGSYIESKLVPDGHVKFHITHRGKAWGTVLMVEIDASSNWMYEVDDITLSNKEDNEDIINACRTEHEGWIRAGRLCRKKDCFCHPVDLPNDNSVVHCASCGVLIASTHKTCLKCDKGQQVPGVPLTKLPMRVTVPSPQSDWASHRIIEVLFDMNQSRFKFVRLRRDRQVANTVREAQLILDSQGNTLGVAEVSKFLCGCIPNLLPFRSPVAKKTEFGRLRLLHHRIKGTLYSMFGGENIIDACCGTMHDASNWLHSGSRKVLAVDQDPRQLEKGLDVLSKLLKNQDSLQVKVENANLCQPWMPATSQDGEEDDVTPFADAVFCNFALHFFWETCLTTDVFLRNLTPLLRDRGLFVVTFMRPERIRTHKHVIIRNNEGNVEFEAKLQEEHARVYIASIGLEHEECLIDENELKLRFARMGLNHLWTHSFAELRQMISPQPLDELSDSEIEMSELYCAAVFQMHARSEHESSSAFDLLPDLILPQIYSNLDTTDLVKLRAVSKAFRCDVDKLPTLTAESTWFKKLNKPMFYCERGRLYADKRGRRVLELSNMSIACFLRFGGTTKPVSRQDPHDEWTWTSYRHPYDGYES